MFIEKRFDHLTSADAALDTLEAATPRDMGSPGGAVAEATAGMLSIMKQDVAKARAAFHFVLGQRSIGSQMIDNLNASIHVRALLTDLFLIDEAFKGRRSAIAARNVLAAERLRSPHSQF